LTLCRLGALSSNTDYDAAVLQGLFSAPDPTPGSAFSEGIRARDELLQDMSELVRQREARMDAKRAGGTTHKSVMEYILEDMRTWVGWHVFFIS
jgi:hypothetical protein